MQVECAQFKTICMNVTLQLYLKFSFFFLAVLCSVLNLFVRGKKTLFKSEFKCLLNDDELWFC